ncbi:MAG: ROK family transcriptional regulator [Desulfitobacteriaceae bacterium]|nr:ROK family transcriptional regulator [Desulfitobacteriaceae bacterium]MDI6880446.1 ROK family transcriptional regulator [Desulfitobacteriaceae bacterium]MDI6913175.1 ROK family transcriptional regulator [Desulfitobacteriaceae bacterium]
MKDKGNQEYVKRFNRINVLNLIRKNQTISRQELAQQTGLTPAGISGIVRELVETGYVRELGQGPSNGGRRPIALAFNPENGYILGAEITRQTSTLGIVDLQLKPIAIRRTSIEMGDPEKGLSLLVAAMEALVAETGIPSGKFLGSGFAIPGLLDRHSQILKRSPNLGECWREVPLAEWLEVLVGRPFTLENNSNAAALAEYTLGAGQGIKDLAYVNLGEGFSTGVILNGEILYGSRGYAGEMGHTVVVENGPLCNCGNRGCLESLYAVPALEHRANLELGLYGPDDSLKSVWLEKGRVDIEDILVSVSEQGPYAKELIRQAGWSIGMGIAGIINFYNPEIIVLGGILASAGKALLEPLAQSVRTHAFPEVVQSTRIERSSVGRDAAFYGACLGVVRRLFTPEYADNIFAKERG